MPHIRIALVQEKRCTVSERTEIAMQAPEVAEAMKVESAEPEAVRGRMMG